MEDRKIEIEYRKMVDQDNFSCQQNKVKIRNVAHNKKKSLLHGIALKFHKKKKDLKCFKNFRVLPR